MKSIEAKEEQQEAKLTDMTKKEHRSSSKKI